MEDRDTNPLVAQRLEKLQELLDMGVNPYANDKSGGVRVTALQDVDVAVRHPEAFCRGNNTL